MLFPIIVVLIIIGIGLYGFNVTRNTFRRSLSKELTAWIGEGIINQDQADRLRERYYLGQLEAESQTVLTKAIFFFGAALIAGGIIAFVAAHWEAIPKYGKFILLASVMIISHLIGFYLREIKGDSPHLGHALIVLGTLIFGATIGLVAQMFHLTTEYYNGFLIWSIGAAAIAYAAESVPHGILASIASFVWFAGWLGEHPQGGPFYLLCLPAVSLPFAFYRKSRGSHFVTLIIWCIAVLIYMFSREQPDTVKIVFNSAILMALICLNYGDLSVLRPLKCQDDTKLIGALLFGGLSYLLSFYEVSKQLTAKAWIWGNNWQMATLIALVLIAVGLMILMFKNVAKTQVGQTSARTILGIAALLFMITLLPKTWAVFNTILANLAVIGWGAFLLNRGLTDLDRRYFWLGMLILVAVIVGRFFEYETGLLLKSAAFIVAGLSLMAGGLWFERRKEGRTTHV